MFPSCVLLSDAFLHPALSKGEIWTSTPVVVPILKIKPEQRRTLLVFPMSGDRLRKAMGKWWDVSRCEPVSGCAATQRATVLLPFSRKDHSAARAGWDTVCVYTESVFTAEQIRKMMTRIGSHSVFSFIPAWRPSLSYYYCSITFEWLLNIQIHLAGLTYSKNEA